MSFRLRLPTSFDVGSNMHVSLLPDTKEQADKIFNALTNEGGSILSSLKDEFWGSYYGTCKDRFGVQWMLNYDYPKEETEKKDEPPMEETEKKDENHAKSSLSSVVVGKHARDASASDEENKVKSKKIDK